MNGLTVERVSEAEHTEQKLILRYKGSRPLARLRTDTGIEIPLTQHAKNPWFRINDIGNGCIYGFWINFPGISPASMQKTDTIVAVMTDAGERLMTLDLCQPSGASASNENPTKFLVAVLRAAFEGNPNPVDAALKNTKPKRTDPPKPTLKPEGQTIH